MPETFIDQPDLGPFARLGPQDFEPPNWAALPEDTLQQLTAEGGPGIVTHPATQREFATTEELIPDYDDGTPGNSGITYYFEPGGISSKNICDLVRALPVFRRMQILHPDLVEWLMEKMAGITGSAPRELHKPLLAAYKIMRHLLDRNDPYISHDDGTYDDIFLVR
jgi:hypothetical protein